MCIHRARDSFLEEWPWSDSVDYEPATVARRLSPHPSLPYTAFSFNMRRVNAWLSLIITSAFHASVPSDLCAYVEVHCMYLRIGPELHPSGVPPCDELSCSAVGGFERRIITSCQSAGSFLALVRITWSLQSICWALTEYTWQCY